VDELPETASEGTRAWGFVPGDLGELLTAGAKPEMWGCEKCGVEFFLRDVGQSYPGGEDRGTSPTSQEGSTERRIRDSNAPT